MTRAKLSKSARSAVALLFIALAVLQIQGCSSLNYVSTDTLMEQGIALYNEGDYDASILRFEEVLRREPDRYLAYFYLARSFMAQFKWGSAISNARKALELAPANREVVEALAQSLFGAGMAALKGGDFTQAISRLSEYLQLQPGAADGYIGLARAYIGSNDYGQAATILINGLSAAQQSRGDLARELLSGGRQALSAGQLQAAITMLTAYTRERPADGSALLSLARAYLNDGSLFQALGAAQKALNLDPNSSDAQSLLRELMSR